MIGEVIFQRFCSILQLKEAIKLGTNCYIMLLPSLSSVYLPNIVLLAKFTPHLKKPGKSTHFMLTHVLRIIKVVPKFV